VHICLPLCFNRFSCCRCKPNHTMPPWVIISPRLSGTRSFLAEKAPTALLVGYVQNRGTHLFSVTRIVHVRSLIAPTRQRVVNILCAPTRH
jgi:hypothetical protein